MITNGLIQYLNPENSNRIANLSITDPFAVACFIILATMVPIALILLTITSRRSAASVWASIENERRYRLLRHTALIRLSTASASNENRDSFRSTRATIGTPRRVAFNLPPIREPSTEASIGDTAVSMTPLISVSATSQEVDPPPSSTVPSPASETFSELYDRWWRGPQIEMEFEDPEGRKRWTTQLTDELLRRA